jgi:hypothetical protein
MCGARKNVAAPIPATVVANSASRRADITRRDCEKLSFITRRQTFRAVLREKPHAGLAHGQCRQKMGLRPLPRTVGSIKSL